MYTFTTSGTTGMPKKFTVSDGFMEARAEARMTSRGDALDGITSMFCDIGPSTTSGVAYKLWAKKANVKYFDNGGGSMASTLALFDKEDIDTLVSGPSGLLNYAMAKGPHKFKAIFCSGAKLTSNNLKTIQDGLGENVIITYGASEVGSIATATADQAHGTPGCVGSLCLGVQVEFEDGQIKVKTTTMITGYDDASLDAKYFKDGWFYPGDLAHMMGDLLVLDGRVSR